MKTVSGDCCIFPFEYYNKQYYSCKLGDGGRWCALTENYEEDKWGYCKEGKKINADILIPRFNTVICKPRLI